MAVEVKIPPMGESITGGLLAAWLVKSGDAVRKGQPLLIKLKGRVEAYYR